MHQVIDETTLPHIILSATEIYREGQTSSHQMKSNQTRSDLNQIDIRSHHEQNASCAVDGSLCLNLIKIDFMKKNQSRTICAVHFFSVLLLAKFKSVLWKETEQNKLCMQLTFLSASAKLKSDLMKRKQSRTSCVVGFFFLSHPS